MDWQGALRARLTGTPAVADLVGGRVFWLERPQAPAEGSALPAIVLQAITEEHRQHFRGFMAWQFARVQIDVWGARLEEVRPIVQAAIAVLAPSQNGNGVAFTRGLIEPVNYSAERQGEVSLRRGRFDLLTHHKIV